MIPTATQLAAIGGTKGDASNMESVIAGLRTLGARLGLDKEHRLAHYLAQLAEESGAWRYDREIASGAEYEGRKDLGNTQPGDGVRFKGRTALQITGRANYRAFTRWCRENVGASVPDFEVNPDLVNTDPWEGLAPLWFWSTHNLNALADENNIEQITKRINGGLRGYAERVRFFTRAALVLLGYGPNEVMAFQRRAIDKGWLPAVDPVTKRPSADGDAGPKTRAALFMALAGAGAVDDTEAVQPSPVVTTVEQPVEVPVVAKGADKRGWLWGGGLTAMGGTVWSSLMSGDRVTQIGIAVGVVVVLAIMLFFGERIIARTKRLVKEIES